jgi:hypothetical protein
VAGGALSLVDASLSVESVGVVWNRGGMELTARDFDRFPGRISMCG